MYKFSFKAQNRLCYGFAPVLLYFNDNLYIHFLHISNIIATFATSPRRDMGNAGEQPKSNRGVQLIMYDEKIGWGLAPSDFWGV